MKLNSFKYLTKQGASSLWKNKMMTVASVGVLTACLVIVGFAVLLTENINQMVGYVESQNEMVAFVEKPEEMGFAIESDEETSENGDKTSEEDDKLEVKTEEYWKELISSLQTDIEKVSGVKEVSYVSKEEGLEKLSEDMGDKSYLLDSLHGSENPIRDSFVIKLDSLDYIGDVFDEISAMGGIKQVNAADDVASTFIDVRNMINIIGWSIILALSIVSLVIITNTIRASIFTRHKEINIMKYVGATNAFIRLPFVVEGVCLGLLSAVLAYLLIWSGYTYVLSSFLEEHSTWLQSAFDNVIPFEQISIEIAIFFVISSVGIGTLGSVLSIKNHIKV